MDYSKPKFDIGESVYVVEGDNVFRKVISAINVMIRPEKTKIEYCTITKRFEEDHVFHSKKDAVESVVENLRCKLGA